MKTAIDDGRIGTPVLRVGPREVVPSARVLRATRAGAARGASTAAASLMNQAIHTRRHAALAVRSRGARVGARRDAAPRRSTSKTRRPRCSSSRAARFGVFEASTAAFPGFPRRIEVTGTQGTLVHEQEARPALVADASRHQRVFEDFLAAIATNGTPACDAREGRRSVALIEAIYRSARSTGGSVTP